MNIAEIECWCAYFVPHCYHTNPPKDKYVVIACINKNPMGFFINSWPTEWMQKRPHLLETCNPLIRVAEHSFLKHDSIVDCGTIYEFFESDIRRKLGRLSEQAKAEILQAIDKCPLLERGYKKLILRKERYPGYEP